MEPEQTTDTQEVEKKLTFNKVTPLSKYLVMLLFIVLPFISGWIGYTYTPEKIVEVEKVVVVEKEVVMESATPSVELPATDVDIVSLEVENAVSEIDLVEFECIERLSYEDDLYTKLENIFTLSFPEWSVYDAGSFCNLPNNRKLVSFSFYKKDFEGEWRGTQAENAGQTIVLFDKDFKIVNHIEDFLVKTLGDHGVPRIVHVDKNKVVFMFSSGDAGLSGAAYHQLALDDFSHQELFSYSLFSMSSGEIEFSSENLTKVFNVTNRLETDLIMIGNNTAQFTLQEKNGDELYSEVIKFNYK